MRSTLSPRSSAPTRETHDVISINGASAALMISGIPFDGRSRGRVAYRPRASGCRTRLPAGRRVDLELVVAGRALSETPTPRCDHDGRGRWDREGWEYYEAGPRR